MGNITGFGVRNLKDVWGEAGTITMLPKQESLRN